MDDDDDKSIPAAMNDPAYADGVMDDSTWRRNFNKNYVTDLAEHARIQHHHEESRCELLENPKRAFADTKKEQERKIDERKNLRTQKANEGQWPHKNANDALCAVYGQMPMHKVTDNPTADAPTTISLEQYDFTTAIFLDEKELDLINKQRNRETANDVVKMPRVRITKLWRPYIDENCLRERAVGERSCSNENECVAVKRLPQFGMPLPELLLPDQRVAWNMQRELPPERRMCFLCAIYHAGAMYAAMMRSRGATPPDDDVPMRSRGTTPPDDCVPLLDFCVDTMRDYSLDQCYCDTTNCAVGLIYPIPAFCERYFDVVIRNNVKYLRQSGYRLAEGATPTSTAIF